MHQMCLLQRLLSLPPGRALFNYRMSGYVSVSFPTGMRFYISFLQWTLFDMRFILLRKNNGENQNACFVEERIWYRFFLV